MHPCPQLHTQRTPTRALSLFYTTVRLTTWPLHAVDVQGQIDACISGPNNASAECITLAPSVRSLRCSDIPPDSTYTCEQQAVEFGKCDVDFMYTTASCLKSCNRCGGELLLFACLAEPILLRTRKLDVTDVQMGARTNTRMGRPAAMLVSATVTSTLPPPCA